MNLLSAENISRSYGDKVILDQISFGLSEGERVGLIGVNGSGKSTFLKIIAGLEKSEGGKVIHGNSLRIEYLPQEPPVYSGVNVLEQVFRGKSPLMKLIRNYEACLEQLSHNQADPVWTKRLLELSQEMDETAAWQLESEAKSILTKLGISDFQAEVSTLSGGQRKRIALAGALINPADILVLDEPTNHIDNETVAWLEQYLAKSSGALLMVTHDRYFLDRVTNRIIEINQGKLYSYTGNYSQYLEIKAEREEQEEASAQKRQNLYRKELAWIKRGAKARTTKQKARIERFSELSEEQHYTGENKLVIAMGANRLGKKVIELQAITKAWGEDKVVIEDFSHLFLKDDRIGIIGPNGSGKSTLLKIIAGLLSPDRGTVEFGSTVKIGYFAQENAISNEDMRVIDYIKEGGEYLPTVDGGRLSAGQMLEKFLFTPREQWTPINRLSGGEKRRLCLLRILMEAPNVLLLDEPTNDLDIPTLTILEDYLDDFPGAVVLVSHDRFLLDRLVDKVFAFEEPGVIGKYNGGYTEYEENKQAALADREKENTISVPGKERDLNMETGEKRNSPQKKLSYNEQREYAEIEDLISATEAELQEIKERIDLAASDYLVLEELLQSKIAIEEELDQLLERWTYLTDLVEEINDRKQNS